MDFLPFTRPSISEDSIAAVVDVLRSGWITTGPKASAFEAALSAYVGGRPVRVASSATAALEFALRIAGVGAGDEVITTPLSWVATANVILTVGATPVFVDVDPVTRNLDLAQVEAAITPRTKLLLPVHLFGVQMDLSKLIATGIPVMASTSSCARGSVRNPVPARIIVPTTSRSPWPSLTWWVATA